MSYRKERISLATPHMSREGYENEYVKEAFATNWIAPVGPNVDAFENQMASLLGVGATVALSSGTAAIHMALKSAGVGQGDVVFCQSLTFVATANPILYQGAIPVFIDSERETWNMSPDALERAFSKYKSVKAVIVVHLYGLPADMDRIRLLCRTEGAALIEDAAESLGATYHGKPTGSIGDYGALSFNGNKIITTSGGGMMTVNLNDKGQSETLAKKVRFWATHSKDSAKHYRHSEIGYNYRMSNVLAGIGIGQLKVLEQRVRRKREIFDFYRRALEDLPDVAMMPIPKGSVPSFWLSCLTVADRHTPLDILIALEKENIETRQVWKPMHLQSCFAHCDFFDNGGVAQSVFEHGICLPSDTKLTNDQLQRVVDAFLSIWR